MFPDADCNQLYTQQPRGPTAINICDQDPYHTQHAGASRGTLNQVLVDYTTDVQVTERTAMFNPDSIKRSVRRQRAKHLPKNPESLLDIVVKEYWTNERGVDKNSFVICDSGFDSANGILVVATDAGLRHLASSDKLFMDRTFDSAPPLFSQLYMIRSPLSDSSVSCM